MDQVQECMAKARYNVGVAQHMLGTTFPLVKDPRLLMTALENVFLAFTNAMAAVLHAEHQKGRIPPFGSTFGGKYDAFSRHVMPRYGVDPEFARIMVEIRDLLLERRKAPIEFSRGDRFVICSGTYAMRSVTVEQMKKYISSAGLYIAFADGILK